MAFQKPSPHNVVIICRHIVDDPTLAQFAEKDEPIDASDSGLQVLCADNSHSESDLLVVRFDTLVSLVPSSLKLSPLKVGERADKKRGDDMWIISKHKKDG